MQEDIHKQIMEASKDLFGRYGFTKTTMQEIASECRMSAANIYRFFDGKKDILAAIVTELFQDDQETLRGIARKKDLTASQKIMAFTLAMLGHTYELDLDTPRIREACNFICEERFDIVLQHKEVKKSILAEILAEGNRSGEFHVSDIIATATDILNATMICQYPNFATYYPREELEKMTEGIVKLLLRGLR
ncbi:TetR/AcrR family transcriptional regulator [Thermodesulfobacteriota bacterium]